MAEVSLLARFSEFAIERSCDAVYWIEEDASIAYANPAASRLTGYDAQELRAKKVYELNVDLDPSRWDAMWGLLEVERHRTFEARHRAKDGRVLEVEVNAYLFELDGRECACAFVRDLGASKQLEQRLRQAEKMEAIGRLAGGVAHDFNNQLAAMMGCAEVLRQKLGPHSQLLGLVDELSRIVGGASDLTAQLLAFSRRGKFLNVPVDVHAVIREVLSMLLRSIDKRVEIETDLLAERSWVLGDPSQLQNAVLNLALNARDAMPGGGKLTLRTGNVELGGAVEVVAGTELAAGPYLALCVQDTGVGMDQDTQQRVFEPFFTTKEAGNGTGLGLAAVYGTVKNHKGGIAVQSELGQGASFTLYLPVTRKAAQVPAHTSRDEPPGMRLRGHVLFVDDEPALRAVGAQMLEALGCTVACVADGASALSYLRGQRGSVDLVLLDLMLPGMSGAETFRALKAIDPMARVLVMSGFSVDGEAQELIDSGAYGFLQKPFTMAALARMVGAALRE